MLIDVCVPAIAGLCHTPFLFGQATVQILEEEYPGKAKDSVIVKGGVQNKAVNTAFCIEKDVNAAFLWS